ncbi:hypothetical protein JCM11251_002483 [Rhodosporidiobolus azoricus]
MPPIRDELIGLEECGFLQTLHFAMNKFKAEVVRHSWADEPLRINEVVFHGGTGNLKLLHYTTNHQKTWCIPTSNFASEHNDAMVAGVGPEFYPSIMKRANGKIGVQQKPGVFQLKSFNFNHDRPFYPTAFTMTRPANAESFKLLGANAHAPQHATQHVEYQYRLPGSDHVYSVFALVTFALGMPVVASLAHEAQRRQSGRRVRVLTSQAY